MSATHKTPDENDLIASLRKRTKRSIRSGSSRNAVALGIGDDCAILRAPQGQEIVVTTDMSLENVHFRRAWHSPESVGYRCLARGLSDLASMGAQPLAAFLSLALPAELIRGRRGQSSRPARLSRPSQLSWRDRFFAGFLSLADRYNVPLAGGDTAQSPSCECGEAVRAGLVMADVILIGSVPAGRALLRSGASAGDRIYVSGHLGGGLAELGLLASREKKGRIASAPRTGDSVRHPNLFPEPRIAVGTWLMKQRRATAAIDLSDGLSTDLDHLCQESGLAAIVNAESIPIHPVAQRVARSQPMDGQGRDPAVQFAVDGGDDYELLFTAAPDVQIPPRIAGVPVTCIGQMRRSRANAPRVVLREKRDGVYREGPLPAGGWKHFA